MLLPFTPEAPARTPETEAFWEAAREGRLLIKRCGGCGEAFFYPRALCPFCWSDTEWSESSGRGEVYSHTTVYGRDLSYVIALVTLAEGPTVLTPLALPDGLVPTIGQKVRVAFNPTAGDDVIPVFVPD